MSEGREGVLAASRLRDGVGRVRGISSDRLAVWSFATFVAIAAPLILFGFGSYRWFLTDEFTFLTDRGLPDLGAAYGDGSHWVVVPRLIFFVLWRLFGLTTYVPYQACVVALHLLVVVLIRLVMRRSGVSPWLATAAAAPLVLFGPGAENIVWAFQVSFTGSMAYGLAHLLLADHDGPFGRRDLLGLAFGALAIMSSSVGVVMVVVVGLAVLWQRGWRMAASHTVPLAILFGIWALASSAATATPLGQPSAPTTRSVWPSTGVFAQWVRSSVIGTFLGLGHFQVVAVLLVLLLVTGLVLAVRGLPRADLRHASRHLAKPTALFVGAILCFAITGVTRWAEEARASRYIYMGAAFMLPLLAIAAQAITERWRALTPALAALFLVAIPFNLDTFEPKLFGGDFMANQRATLTTAVRMPFATEVPPDVQVVHQAIEGEGLTIGFLLEAERTGRLTPSTDPIGPQTIEEFKVRLGIATAAAELPASGCRTVTGPLKLSPAKGDTFIIRRRVFISTAGPSGNRGPPVGFDGGRKHNELTIVLDDLHLLIRPASPEGSFILCTGT